MSVTVDVVNTKGKKTGSVDLPEEVFDAQANISLMHQVVVAQLAAKRQGTSKAKGRGEVSGGGAKPYRQKGTGRARQGSTRAPQFVGGGVVHGPQPRSYAQKTPKKMKAAALRGALSDRARAGLVYVVSSLVAEGVVSTKTALGALRSVCSVLDTPKKRVLVVLGRDDLAGWVSLRNVPSVHLLVADQLNTYDVLVSDAVVFTQGALEQFLGDAAEFTISEVEADDTASDTGDADTAEATTSKPKARRSARKAAPLVATPAAEDDGADADAPEADDTDTDTDADADSGTDEAPYGESSHAALPDDSAPEGFDIKGNADSMLYHVPGSAFYDRTVAEVWFATEAAAESAGFELPPSQRDDETSDDETPDDESGAAK